ncbi:MAG: glycosyltransferase family 2 protein [Bacteroidota bacterium]|nr:glycosyltransferase family 2 protein [Bacteroidota bacterium]
METQKIAVIVLNWNGRSWLEKFLPTLVAESASAKIYLGDNASTDDSVLFVKNNFPSIHIIQNKVNDGYCKGYNNILKNINAEYFVLINSDIEVTKNWLEPVISLMDSEKSIAACQPKILDYNNREYFEYAGASGGFLDILGYPFCRGRVFKDLEKDVYQYENNMEIFWATGACIFVRSSSFWEVNGFDEDFFAHMEEIDLCWRLKNLGYKIMACPASSVYHVGGGTLDESSSFKTYLNFRNNLSMLFKNLPFFQLFWILPIRLMLDGIAALSFFINNQNGISHFLAVAKAHFSFYFLIPRLFLKRYNNTISIAHKGRFMFSILLKYYIMGYKKYSEL